MTKPRRLVTKGSRTESQLIIDGGATSPAIVHAAQSLTVVLTVTVDDARLSRSVAIRWHPTAREGLQKTGSPTPTPTPSADGAEDVRTPPPGHTITYNFVADRPGTFTYRARYRRDRDRAASRGGVRVQGNEGGRTRVDAGHGVVNVPWIDPRPPAGDSRAARPATTAVRRADGRGSRGMGSVVAQIMGDCPVIYYSDAEYGGGPPIQQLLRWSVDTLAAAALWVSGICGPRDPDVRRRVT